MLVCRVLRLLGIILTLALLGACGREAGEATPHYIRIVGSTSMMPALNEWAAAYSALHPDVSLDVQGSDTTAGLRALLNGKGDLAAASWKMELENEGAVRLNWYPVARDGLALIVHPHNTLRDISLTKARELFAGWPTNWSEAGGRGGEVQVLSREDGSGTRAAFEAGVMAGRRVTQTALVMPSSQAVVQWVASHPDAIGYVSMAYITTTVEVVSLEGVSPTIHNVENGSYPLIRVLYLVTHEPASHSVEDFVRFCLSPAGQAIIRKYHGKPD